MLVIQEVSNKYLLNCCQNTQLGRFNGNHQIEAQLTKDRIEEKKKTFRFNYKKKTQGMVEKAAKRDLEEIRGQTPKSFLIMGISLANSVSLNISLRNALYYKRFIIISDSQSDSTLIHPLRPFYLLPTEFSIVITTILLSNIFVL